MIPEKMLELLLLLKTSNCRSFNGVPIDRDKHDKRRRELLEEFLKPYVKDKAEKSE